MSSSYDSQSPFILSKASSLGAMTYQQGFVRKSQVETQLVGIGAHRDATDGEFVKEFLVGLQWHIC